MIVERKKMSWLIYLSNSKHSYHIIMINKFKQKFIVHMIKVFNLIIYYFKNFINKSI